MKDKIKEIICAIFHYKYFDSHIGYLNNEYITIYTCRKCGYVHYGEEITRDAV